MRKFAKLFPAKARKHVARTDWSAKQGNNEAAGISVYTKRLGTRRVCPIGLAMVDIGTPFIMPFASVVIDEIGSHPERFNRSAIRDSGQWRDGVEEDLREFMDRFDAGRLSNADIAEAFGYPDLAAQPLTT